jgi:enoyl-CoA hydratase
MTDLVRVSTEDGVAVVLVDNPPVNAMSDATIDALAAAGERIAADETIRAVVLGGAGEKAFLAGADLDEFGSALGDRDWIDDHTARVRRTLDRWESLPQPVVAAVQASAMGGGLEVMLTCDLVVADPAARFGLPEVRLGLMPGAGGTQRLPRRIGVGPAKEMLLLGSSIDAESAKRLGLVTVVSAPGAAASEARGLAEKLAHLSSPSVRAIKASVAQAFDGPLAEGLDRERALFRELFMSADAAEGVRAFMEKRRPDFKHR